MIKKLLIILAVVLLHAYSWAACVASGDDWASTPDYSSVTTCISNADAGDTITVSAGDGTEDPKQP